VISRRRREDLLFRMVIQAACMSARRNTSEQAAFSLELSSLWSPSYGWDWGLLFSLVKCIVSLYLPSGPVLMTIGPWKPIRLHSYANRIVDLDIRSDVSESLDVKITVDFGVSANTPDFASVVLRNPDGSRRMVEATRVSGGHGRTESFFSAGVLDLWYPVGYGRQPIYSVEVQIADGVGFLFRGVGASRS
jgi:hypothetical protein